MSDKPDWPLLVRAGTTIASGQNPYAAVGDNPAFAFRWSPLMAWFFVVVAPIGAIAWAALHLAALGLLRDWRLALLVALSWPFITDVTAGKRADLRRRRGAVGGSWQPMGDRTFHAGSAAYAAP